jgi:hypothetical protein
MIVLRLMVPDAGRGACVLARRAHFPSSFVNGRISDWTIGSEAMMVQGARNADLVRPAEVRWRIERDYRELKYGLGFGHFEGRFWPGWHRHVTFVTAARAFLTEQRPTPEVPGPASPSTRSSTPSKAS